MDVNRLVEAIFNAPVTHLALGIGILLSVSLLGVVIIGLRALSAVRQSNQRWETLSNHLVEITDNLSALFTKFNAALDVVSGEVNHNSVLLDERTGIFGDIRQKLTDLEQVIDRDHVTNELIMAKIDAIRALVESHIHKPTA